MNKRNWKETLREQYLLFMVTTNAKSYDAEVHKQVLLALWCQVNGNERLHRGCTRFVPGVCELLANFRDWVRDESFQEWVRDRHLETIQMSVENYKNYIDTIGRIRRTNQYCRA